MMNNTPNQISQQAVINQHPPQTNQMMQGHNFVNQQPQQQTVQNVQPHMTNPNQNPEMIIKTKKLINELKESLANLMNLASKNINYNHQIDSGQKISIEKCPRFERAWGEFNSICNQVETHFKTILECNLLKKESNTHLPFNLSNLNIIENQTPPDTIIYNQYVNLVKNKINYAKVLQDILSEGAKRISLMDCALPQQQQNMHLQQQQYNQQSMINNQMTNQYNPNQVMIKNQQQQHYQMNPQQINQQMMQRGPPMNQQQINQQQMAPQMNQQPMNQQPMNQQPMNQQQINPQQMVGQQIPPQQIVQQQMAPQMASQMNPQMNTQMNMNPQQPMNQIPMQQQMNQPPIQQQMHPQQMNNQLGQIKQQPQYIPHNQM